MKQTHLASSPVEADAWNPKQYQKFAKERDLPFHDLVNLISIRKNMNVVDLGCGTGHLTLLLHERLKAKHTLGIDSSLAMLKESHSLRVDNLEFQLMNIQDFKPKTKYDLIFSNAALQWLPDHSKLFETLSKYLNKRGQMAIQMPANFDYPTHRTAREIGNQPHFKQELAHALLPSVLSVEEYAVLLYRLGFKKQVVRLQVYPHILNSTEDVLEWVKGSLLTYYQKNLSPAKYAEFYKIYREKIIDYFGNERPFFLPFKRILIWCEY